MADLNVNSIYLWQNLSDLSDDLIYHICEKMDIDLNTNFVIWLGINLSKAFELRIKNQTNINLIKLNKQEWKF